MVPELCSKEIEPIQKTVQRMKTHKKGMKTSLFALKNLERKSQDTSIACSIAKFVIKKHLHHSHLFEKTLVRIFSEFDFVVKFGGP